MVGTREQLAKEARDMRRGVNDILVRGRCGGRIVYYANSQSEIQDSRFSRVDADSWMTWHSSKQRAMRLRYLT
jgi:hypothetical protein